MGAPNIASARSTISMARSTPAQNPLGLASRMRMRALAIGPCGLGPALLHRFSQGIEDHQRRADGDRTVRDVEGREIRVAPVHGDEVHDVAEVQPIDEITE